MNDHISEKGIEYKGKVETLMKEITPMVQTYINILQIMKDYENTEFPMFVVRTSFLQILNKGGQT